MTKQDRRNLLKRARAKWPQGFWVTSDEIEKTGERIPREVLKVDSAAAAELFVKQGNPRLFWYASDQKPPKR